MNYWTCLGDAIAKWDADLSALWSRPESMLEWVRQVTVAAERFEVMKVLESPTLDYQRDRDGSLVSIVEHLFDASRTVDLFYHTCPSVPVNGVYPRPLMSGKVAYYNEQGGVQEEEIQQLGQLLRRFRPEAFDTGVGAVVSPLPPLILRGPRLCFSDRKKSLGMFNPSSVHVYFSTYSDIWQPWVAGMWQDDWSHDRHIDNRPLAERHTPRLNAFLGQVQDLTLAMGGKWEYLPDDSKLDWTRLYWNGGVRMDG